MKQQSRNYGAGFERRFLETIQTRIRIHIKAIRPNISIHLLGANCKDIANTKIKQIVGISLLIGDLVTHPSKNIPSPKNRSINPSSSFSISKRCGRISDARKVANIEIQALEMRYVTCTQPGTSRMSPAARRFRKSSNMLRFTVQAVFGKWKDEAMAEVGKAIVPQIAFHSILFYCGAGNCGMYKSN